MNVLIVGGGPSGLLTAYYLEGLGSELFKVTLAESSGRLGGKVVTSSFEKIPARYEAGLAELYDYSHIGIDPLKRLVHELGLATLPLRGSAVLMGDEIVRGEVDLTRCFGWDTFASVKSFYRTCARLYAPEEYYNMYVAVDANHPWASRTFRSVLDELENDKAREFIETVVRSDTATEPHLTSALNGLKNVLMDDPRYMRLYSIEGGNERFIDRLVENIGSTEILKNTRVTGVERSGNRPFVATFSGPDGKSLREFDVVIAAIPNYWLSQIDWRGEALSRAIREHLVRYDHPAHYLRVTAAFKEPFWRQHLKGGYFLSNAFGGCCLYDESARHPCDPFGVLSWLLAGNDAMVLSNLSDSEIISLALDSLPGSLAEGKNMLIEGRVHRWIGAVNAIPGGWEVQNLRERHQPARDTHPELFVVGDYLFDSTLNAASDSADFVSNLVLDLVRRRLFPHLPMIQVASAPSPASERQNQAPLADNYFDLYDGSNDYEDSLGQYFDENYVCDLIGAIWDRNPPYRLLDCGSANGLTLARFARRNVEAWGVENSPYIHARTPEEWRHRNLLADVRKLPFPDGHFDFVYETCLCYLPEADLPDALRELFRVCRVGVFFASITSDMTQAMVEAHDLHEGLKTLSTGWEWSERFVRAGFRIATADADLLSRTWQIELAAAKGGLPWYQDAEAMRYCFYSKPEASLSPAAPIRSAPAMATLDRAD